jgi:hypothetical protein
MRITKGRRVAANRGLLQHTGENPSMAHTHLVVRSLPLDFKTKIEGRVIMIGAMDPEEYRRKRADFLGKLALKEWSAISASKPKRLFRTVSGSHGVHRCAIVLAAG